MIIAFSSLIYTDSSKKDSCVVSCRQSRGCLVPANRSLSRSKNQGTYGSPFPARAAVPSLPRACSPRGKKSIAPHSVPHSPHPPRYAKGASLFVPESSRAFLSCPRTMHDEIRTGPPYGHALPIPHFSEAHTKTTLSFQNLEAALPPGIPAGRRSNSRSSVL